MLLGRLHVIVLSASHSSWMETLTVQNLSCFVGKKKFLLGERTCSADCAVFGMLAQIHWHSPDSESVKIYKSKYLCPIHVQLQSFVHLNFPFTKTQRVLCTEYDLWKNIYYIFSIKVPKINLLNKIDVCFKCYFHMDKYQKCYSHTLKISVDVLILNKHILKPNKM